MDIATVDRLLTTTRTVRRRLDLTRAVPASIVRECIEVALQAPTAGGRQGWHFMVVTDASKKAAIADVYRKARARTTRTRRPSMARTATRRRPRHTGACGRPETTSPSGCRTFRC